METGQAQAQPAAAVVQAVAFAVSALNIATRIDGSTVDLGVEAYSYPTLESIGLAAPDKVEEVKLGDQVRITPVYTDEKLAFIQECVIAKVESICRNAVKIDKKAAGGPSYSLSRDFPTDWASLLEGSGGAQYFVIRKQALGMFEMYLNTAGVPENGVVQLVKAISDDKLAMRSEAAKENIGKYVNSFAESLDDEQLGGINMYLKKVEDWLNTAPDDEDFDFESN